LYYRSRLRGSGGFSLIEVVLVVLIMSILASVAAQKYTGVVEQTRFDTTREEMERLSEAIVGNPALTSGGVRSDFGYVGDVGSLPPNLDALVSNPGGYATWNGPYVQNDFQQNPNDYKEDAWGATYAYAGGVTLTSSGSGSAETKQFAASSAALTNNLVRGAVTDGLNNPPSDSAASVSISIRYPDGLGSLTTASVNPSSGGNFSFGTVIPVGNHEITAIYQSDTLVRYVSVLPGSDAIANFRLPGDLWSPAGGGGGGGGGSGLVYVANSATDYNSGKDMSFDVTNTSGALLTITSIAGTYASATYFEETLIGGTAVFNGTNPRGSSGDTKLFGAININDGATVTIRYNTFKLCISGGCSNGDTRGVAFTIDFSNGSTINFTVP
jgi:prepilin-type N-terminal cleavage/methylation domain-containing protein